MLDRWRVLLLLIIVLPVVRKKREEAFQEAQLA